MNTYSFQYTFVFQYDCLDAFFLGNCYEKGIGVSQDYSKAIEWYTEAANQGDAATQVYLGSLYEDGEIVKKDIQKAIELYKKALEQGDSSAKSNLERLGVSY